MFSKRSIKTESEIALIKEACEIAEKAYYQAIDGVYEGMTEKQLRDAIELNVKNLGGEIAFDTIVAFGSNSAIPHHETDDTKLTLNSPILVDMGAKKSGYISLNKDIYKIEKGGMLKKIFKPFRQSETFKIFLFYRSAE